MASEEKAPKKLVIILAGLELPPLMFDFLDASFTYSIIVNTTADFLLSDSPLKNQEKDKENSSDIWYHHEIVKLASAIVPDDLTKSSLTKIFSKPIAQTKIPLNDAEMFLVQWVSERHKANQNFFEFFRALNDYSCRYLEIFPLKFPEEVVSIKTQNSQVPLRYFQITGFIDRIADQKPDLEELQNLLVIEKENKAKKKAQKLIEIIGLDFTRDILTNKAKKAITEADAILWLAEDPCSLSLLLLNKEFTKTVSESKASATLVFPSKFSFREQFILELLDVKPTLLGIAELGSGIVDNLLLGPEDTSEINDLRSMGFNVIIEDITKIKDKKDLSPILKSMGISQKDISIKTGEVEKKLNIDELVTQLSYAKTDDETPPVTPEVVKDEVEPMEEKPSEVVLESTIKTDQENVVRLQDTRMKNYDFSDPSLKLTQEMVESLMEELTSENSPDQKTTIVIDNSIVKPSKPEDSKPEIKAPSESQEAFTEAIQTFLETGKTENNQELIQRIIEIISKDADMANYAAKKFTRALDDQTKYPHLLSKYLEFLEPRPSIFIKELLNWVLEDLESPDFVSLAQKAKIIGQMRRDDLRFPDELIAQMIDYQITKSLSPKEREHIRTLVGMIVARDVTLQRRVIRSYLRHYETSKKYDEIWLGLLKFDAGLVALEIIEYQTKMGVQIVQDVLKRNLGSFGHIIYDVFTAYQKGDTQRVISIAGTLSDGLIRKKKRMELAEKITKFGSVTIETLAKNVETDPKELETLVIEMIDEKEINARIDVVEGRLTIVQLENQENKTEGKTEG